MEINVNLIKAQYIENSTAQIETYLFEILNSCKSMNISWHYITVD